MEADLRKGSQWPLRHIIGPILKEFLRVCSKTTSARPAERSTSFGGLVLRRFRPPTKLRLEIFDLPERAGPVLTPAFCQSRQAIGMLPDIDANRHAERQHRTPQAQQDVKSARHS